VLWFRGWLSSLKVEWFRRALGPVLANVSNQPGWCGQDPAFVLAAVYMYFVHYGLIEQHMGGRRHLGVSNEQAIKQVVELLCGGLWRMPPRAARGKNLRKPSKGSEGQKLIEEAMQSRIDFIRLLSGRMWSTPPEIPVGKSRAREPATVPMLFLPKISRDRPDDTQLRIEAAALELFTTQGFHGTNIREIAEKAGVSQGAIYTYYSSKGALFGGTVTECDLVASVVQGGTVKSYLYHPSSAVFVPGDASAPLSDSALRALAAVAGQEVTYSCVPPGSGARIAYGK
jgi:hypothetical protein